MSIRQSPEHVEQCLLIQWAAVARGRYPDLALLFAIPNGGHRHAAVAAKLKAEGVRAGVPDLCLPVARGPYHALYLELKAGKNRPTRAQTAWLDALREAGNAVFVCYAFEAARVLIEGYLQMPTPAVTILETPLSPLLVSGPPERAQGTER